MFKLVQTLLLYFVTYSEAARILVAIPTPSISHQVVFRPLTQELARRGHEVVVITTDPAFPKGEAPDNLREIDVHDVSYTFWRGNFKVSEKGWKQDPVSHMKLASDLFAEIFEVQIQTEEVKSVLKDHFDLVFVEACARPAFVFSYIFKAPMILLSSIGAGPGTYDIIGASSHPILYPLPIRVRIYNLSFFEKITELYQHFWFMWNYYLLENKVDVMLQANFGKDVPRMAQLRDNVGMLFLNMHPILDGNHPVPPSVVHVWGMHQNPQKELSKELKHFLDSSKNGVIYVSFGTNVNPSKLPEDKMQIFVDVLSQFPYDVLWKWDREDKLAPNIKTEKWFPQSDLLRHPKVKLFITQGGLQSMDEAITAGVPLIGVPIIGDQWYNTEKYVQHRIGLQLDMDTLTRDVLEKAIKEVIENESYQLNIKKLDALLRDQPMPPLERAVWWTEHVLRHSGAPHLRAPAANLSWAQYLELEFLAIVLTCVILIVLLCLTLVYCFWKFVVRFTKEKYKRN